MLGTLSILYVMQSDVLWLGEATIPPAIMDTHAYLHTLIGFYKTQTFVQHFAGLILGN